ncbi:EAL domain-containing protein [Roseomonas sp. PWR1]|uniref:EAL domain-containing protein n=1 Tax=Roseomonas nitratireducens TaxID=2820810 RepID=A0ABS4AUJ5_9PROT|nr:EAL domain-containing protein [Neoroseomonas nitratireducens]MBP0464217.1 EAL domain-containing protein [Neoroseomonas nitratireducens]
MTAARLPAADPAPAALSVLVVDDERDLAEELADGLAEAGLPTRIAGSAEEALRLLAASPEIGVIVTDVRMPGSDGFSFASRLVAEARPETARRVVIMTGQSTLDDASAALRAGAFDYLRKPFSLDDLVLIVTRAADSAAAERKGHQDAQLTRARLMKAEAETARMRRRDQVTGLPNVQALQEAIVGLGDMRVALLMIRLDGLHVVTDAGWRALHDRLLADAASRFAAVAGRERLYALHDAAHFAVLLDGASALEAEAVGRALLAATTEPMRAGDQALALTASVGLATREGAGTAPLDVCAQVATAEAGRQGSGRLVTYSARMHSDAARRLRVTQDLPAAAAAGHLSLMYQPLMTPDLSALLGFEALMRWTHPVLGPIGPGEFIPAAEESGAILDIGVWALEAAAAQAARWRSGTPDAPYVSVNLSGRQLQEADVTALVLGALDGADLPPQALVIEVTETVAAGAGAPGILTALRGRGLRVALDDFGSGYTSLSTLRSLPADIVKFDRSLLPAGAEDARGAAFFTRLIQAVQGLGLDIVAEGIETAGQLALAATAGVYAVQGYGVARPMSADAATARIAAATPR